MEREKRAKPEENSPRRGGMVASLLPPLAVALVCTGLIVEAIYTVMGGRANGDLMLLFVPLLGAIFLSIPALQAWWACIKIVRGR
ncbi:MAG: hypothetical protein ABSF29_12925 [Tepidisphaeraceae bacterium]